MKLAQKVTLVTGAGSGIGQAIALLFAREGAQVVALDIQEDAVQATVQQLTQQQQALALPLDVTSEEAVRATIHHVLQRYGRIDILLNVAGIGSTQTVVETSLETWEKVFAVNARGTFLMSKYTLPTMIEQRSGVILNMASVAGLVGLAERAAYCASKGAVIALTKAMAVDTAHLGIRINAICPGTVDSPWVGRLLASAESPALAQDALIARQPMGRLGTPEEIAEAALYLASDAASFITGTAFVIDGGLTAR